MSKARDLADLGSVTTRLDEVGNTDGALSNRNLIINGAMQVSQRGDYTTATAISNNTYYLDRWKIAAGVSATVTHTGAWQRVDATSSGTTTLRCRQQLEAQDITRFAGQQVTLSAKVKSNSTNARLNIYADAWLTGTGNPTHSGNGQEETLTYTVTLPSGSISLCTIDVGFDGPLSADVSILSGNYFEITEVQLEVGDTATPFEHRSYGQELALCQRYFEKSYNQGTAIGTATPLGARSSGGNQAANTTGEVGTYLSFAVSKRANPSITIYDLSGNVGKTTISLYGTGTTANQTSSVANIGEGSFFVSRSSGSNATELYVHYLADAEL